MLITGLSIFFGLTITDAGSHASLPVGIEGSQSMNAVETPMHDWNHDSSFGDDLHESASLVDLMDPTITPPHFFIAQRSLMHN